MSWRRCSVLVLAAAIAAVCSAQIQRNQVRRDAFGPAWNGDLYRAPSADAVYDEIMALGLPPIGVSPWITSWLSEPNMLDLSAAMGSDGIIDLAWYDPNGDGQTDDAAKIQRAIDDAVAGRKLLLIRRPAADPNAAYRVNSTLTIAADANAAGVRILGVGKPRLLWGGAGNQTVLALAGVSDSEISNLWIDGNDVAGVTGLTWSTTLGTEPNHSCQRNTLRQCAIARCPAVGIEWLTGDPNTTMDHFDLHESTVSDCGVGIRNTRGIRHLTLWDCLVQRSTTYGIDLVQGEVSLYAGVFNVSGTADLYLGGPVSVFRMYGTKSQSDVLLATDPNAGTSSVFMPPNIMAGVEQAADPAPTGVIATYDANRPLILEGCRFQSYFNVGPNVPGVYVTGCQFTAGDFNDQVERVTERVVGLKSYSLTIDDPNSLADPNVMMFRVAVGSFPYGMQVNALGIQCRPATTADVQFYDFNSPTDPSPDLLGTCSVSGGTTDVNDIANVTVATGHTIVVSVPQTPAWTQLEAIVWGRPKAR